MRNPYNMTNICADCLIEIALKDNAEKEADVRRNLREWLKSYTCDTQLGAMLFNVNYHISYIPSKVWDMPWQRLDGTKPRYEDFAEDEWTREYVRAHEMGIEPYRIAMDETRKTGTEVWFSVRMNEFHYLRFPYACASLWKDRPDLRLGEKQAFDYEKKEVRDYYLMYIKEICETYEIDGIELDLWRGPEFFHKPVTSEKAQIITDFLKEIRAVVKEIAKAKNSASTPAPVSASYSTGTALVNCGLLEVTTAANIIKTAVSTVQSVEKATLDMLLNRLS